MANVKISALPAVTTVVPGTDVLPLVSGGVTTKATPNAIINASLSAQTSLSLYGGTWSLANNTTISAASTKTLTLNGGAGSNGLVLDASNNVGIGGAAAQKFHVQNAGAVIGLLQNTASTADARYRVQNTGGSSDWGVDGTGTYFQDNNSRPFIWYTAGSERLRLDSSGNLGLGVTPSAWSLYKGIQLFYGGSITASTVVPITAIGANYYYDGSAYRYLYSSHYASRFLVDGYSGGFSWSIAPSGTAGNAISFTQAMTLDGSGNLLVGTTTNTYSAVGSFKSIADNVACEFYRQGTGSGSAIVTFNSNATATESLRSYIDASSGNLTVISDERVKENISSITYGLADILLLRPVSFTWKNSTGTKINFGFIAQEVESVVPEIITTLGEDLSNTIPNQKMLDKESVIPILVKAIQELSAELNELKQRIN
jgi:hypothetical protein